MSELFTAIEGALRDAVTRSSWRSISVKELCAEAQVTRKAFYKQLDGRSDVLRRILDRDVVHPAVELCTLLPFERMRKLAPEMERHMFAAVLEDGRFYRDVVNAAPGGEEAFKDAATSAFRAFNLFMLEELDYAGGSRQAEAVASYFAEGKAGYIARWIKSDYEASVDDVSSLYSAMVLPFWRSLR